MIGCASQRWQFGAPDQGQLFIERPRASSISPTCRPMIASRTVVAVLPFLLLLACEGPVPADDGKLPAPLILTESTKLDPKKTYSRIVVKASDITIDGQGAWLIGAIDGK